MYVRRLYIFFVHTYLKYMYIAATCISIFFINTLANSFTLYILVFHLHEERDNNALAIVT